MDRLPQQRTRVYNLNNVKDKDKTVVIEHPFQKGWKLVKTPEPIEILRQPTPPW